MSEHVHKFKVDNRESCFGMVHIHAVMKCDGVVDGNPCPARLTKVVAYSELETKGDKHLTYFYREPQEKEANNG